EAEHDAVYQKATKRGRSVTVSPRDTGRHDVTEIHASSGGHDLTTGLFAFAAANGETGVLDDIPALAIAAHSTGAQFLTDAVQAIGKAPFSFGASGADYALSSGHKIGAPKGVGALLLRNGVELPAPTLGGGQEMGRRSGTENVIGVAGFGAAAEAAQRDLEAGLWEKVAKLRNILEISLDAVAKDIIFVGIESDRLPNTSCFAVPGWKGETQVMQMDLAGFAISAGSACSSGKVKTSRVLQAMGYDDMTASSAVRVSLGPLTTEDEVTRFVEAWSAAYRKRRSRAAVSMGAGS
ncbi:MAG: aminotransferase class V-fold PLP-dependent enzyme, partial [Pseudomonadota bacterium]